MVRNFFEFHGGKIKIRVDKFLAEQLTGKLSREQVQRLITGGQAHVNGRTVLERDFLLSTGDKVTVDYELPRLIPRPDIPLKVIYQDSDLLVLDKPAGIVVHPTPGQDRDSLAAALVAQIRGVAKVGDRFRPGIVHRLDKDTSGLMVVAKDERAYKFLQRAFKSRQVIKYYIALIHGRLAQSHGVFNRPIGRRTGQRTFRAGFGREAKTEYWVEAEYQQQDTLDLYTLVRIQLHTGRTHQIRVHFAAAGHPVAGDRLYGGQHKSADPEFFSRQFLHASYLKFPHPAGGEKAFESPLTDELQAVLSSLKKLP